MCIPVFIFVITTVGITCKTNNHVESNKRNHRCNFNVERRLHNRRMPSTRTSRIGPSLVKSMSEFKGFCGPIRDVRVCSWHYARDTSTPFTCKFHRPVTIAIPQITVPQSSKGDPKRGIQHNITQKSCFGHLNMLSVQIPLFKCTRGGQ